jgi:hypothetical protein
VPLKARENLVFLIVFKFYNFFDFRYVHPNSGKTPNNQRRSKNMEVKMWTKDKRANEKRRNNKNK